MSSAIPEEPFTVTQIVGNSFRDHAEVAKLPIHGATPDPPTAQAAEVLIDKVAYFGEAKFACAAIFAIVISSCLERRQG